MLKFWKRLFGSSSYSRKFQPTPGERIMIAIKRGVDDLLKDVVRPTTVYLSQVTMNSLFAELEPLLLPASDWGYSDDCMICVYNYRLKVRVDRFCNDNSIVIFGEPH